MAHQEQERLHVKGLILLLFSSLFSFCFAVGTPAPENALLFYLTRGESDSLKPGTIHNNADFLNLLQL